MSIAQVLEKAVQENRLSLTEVESKELLKEAGIPVVETRLAGTQKEAIALSRGMGFPVALKVASSDVIHKSDAGGVRLGLTHAAQVGKAYKEIMASTRQTHPGAVIQGVSVQKMARPGIEVIIGSSKDAQFGQVLMFGLGGTLVELLKDVSLRVSPVTRKDISEMIREIKGAKLLEGYRGREGVDTHSLEQILEKVSVLVTEHPQIKEIDLNPVFVFKEGAVAVDARIILEPQSRNDMEGSSPAGNEKLNFEKNGLGLEKLFSPRGVAVVGASTTIDAVMGAASFPNQAVQVLKQAGFPAVYPVNPKYNEVQGLPCYPDLDSIPGVVDHVIVSIPAEATLKLLDDCAKKGVRSVHIFSAGFSETGETQGAELEKQLLRKAREGNFRIIGPNCIGMMAPGNRLVSKKTMPFEPGRIAFFSQSGGYAEDLPLFSSPRGLRFSKMISYGNALDVGESEILEYLARDPETEIIAAYIEGTKNGKYFIQALKEATARKPVVIQKGGSTESGRRAAYGHTASLTGSAAVFSALCRQHNVLQVDDPEEMIDTMVGLRFARPMPKGTGVAIIGTGGGPSVIASDEMEKAGLRVPPLSGEVQAKMKRFLIAKGGILINPVDARNLISPEAISATLSLLGKLPEIHTLIYHMGFHPISQWGDERFTSAPYLQALTDAFREAQRNVDKPVMVALCSPLNLAGMRDYLVVQEALVRAQLPTFHSLRGVARSVARLVTWSQARHST